MVTDNPMPISDALKALARKHAAQIVYGDVPPVDGARAIWADMNHQLQDGDHAVDQFAYWADAIAEAESEQRRARCEVAIIRLARELLQNSTV
jgi:hypothetical protein